MKTLIVAVVIAGIIEGFIETIVERRRVAKVIIETRQALDARWDEIAVKRERMIEREFVA